MPSTIRTATTDDAPLVARWHLAAFPDGFYARLGGSFLVRYHRARLASPHAVTLMTLNANGHPVGYVTGVINDLAHSNYMKRAHGPSLGAAATFALGRRPNMWVSTLRKRARPYLRLLLGPRPSIGGSARLDYVYVEDASRLAGTGGALVDAFVGTLRQSGAQAITLVTRAAAEESTRFWIHLGWLPAGTTRTHDGDELVIFCTGLERP